MRRRFLATIAIMKVLCCATTLMFAQERDRESPPSTRGTNRSIREALDDNAAGFWIYDDLEAGFDNARRTGKPILLSIR